MSDAIYRYEVPVEVWALHTDSPTETRTIRVYGTGQPLPDDAVHCGTAIAPGGQLVWHLIEIP